MQKRMWVWVMLFFMIPGLLLTVSCQKAVKPDTGPSESEIEMQRQKAAEAAEAEARALARKKAKEKERLRKERLRKEQLARKAEGDRKSRAAAKRQFLKEDLYFEYDSSALLPEAENVLNRKADWLRDNRGVSVKIEGHCDERGTNEYNLALGDRRAESAKAYLINLGIGASRLTTISYGEERPVDKGHNERAWGNNRRGHFKIN